jgi:hypothetical protein
LHRSRWIRRTRSSPGIKSRPQRHGRVACLS